MRILTGDQIRNAANEVAMPRVSGIEFHGLFDEAEAICKAQAALTLNEVGEWLKHLYFVGNFLPFPVAIREGIAVLLRGEMPEEEKHEDTDR